MQSPTIFTGALLEPMNATICVKMWILASVKGGYLRVRELEVSTEGSLKKWR